MLVKLLMNRKASKSEPMKDVNYALISIVDRQGAKHSAVEKPQSSVGLKPDYFHHATGYHCASRTCLAIRS